jgi:hypothetical protein
LWGDECEEERTDPGIAAATDQHRNLWVILMLPGIAALISGKFFYTDYRNLLVFAPFSLLLGLVMIVFALRVGKK